MWCDIISMDACHFLDILGSMIGMLCMIALKTHTFTKDEVKLTIGYSKPKNLSKLSIGEDKTLYS